MRVVLLLAMVLAVFILYFFIQYNFVIRDVFAGTFVSKSVVMANKSDTRERIVVSLTTSPKRIGKIAPVIDCIMKQTIQPARIYLNLPKVFKRDNSTFDEIPEFLKNNPSVYVNWCEDIGPATKVIPTARLERDPETKIISIDDDIYYPPNFIETFLSFSLAYPDACITGTSFIPAKKTTTDKQTPEGTYVQLLEGYSGVLYKQKFFNDIDMNLLREKACYLGDDFFLSNELLKQDIPIIMIGRSYDAIKAIKPLDYGLQSDALHLSQLGGNDINYRKCSNILEKQSKLHVHFY